MNNNYNISKQPAKRKIFKNGVRIFRPTEWQAFINAIPKQEYRTKMEALLFSGARYTELQWLYNNPSRFDGKNISMISLKAKVRHKERYIKLNDQGRMAVTYFLRGKRNLPMHHGWQENMKRWAFDAGLSEEGVGCKTSRKTYESWLATMYPNNWNHIFLSQGHTDRVSLEYYMMIPFDDEDKQEMEFYTRGWMK